MARMRRVLRMMSAPILSNLARTVVARSRAITRRWLVHVRAP